MIDQAVARGRWASVLRGIWAVCLLGGMSTHVETRWAHGIFWDYGGVPLVTRVYWTSLTFLDPLAAILLLVRPRAGAVATLSIMLTDVAHNLWFGWIRHLRLTWPVAAQCAFLVFVLVTVPAVWRRVSADSPDGPGHPG